jgi:hypothetical protein
VPAISAVVALSGARPPAQHRAPIASYRMTDLKEEINRR